MARNVFIDLIGRDRFSPVAERAAASATAAASKMSAANARMAKSGAAATRSITVPLLAVAAVSTKVAIDYQKSMTLLQTAGGETARKTAIISKGIQDVAIKTGSSLKDLTEGMYIVAKAGSQKWSAAGQLNVLKAAAEGAKAENVDLATATNALTSVMMSYHMGASQAVQVQNMLVVGAGRAKTTMQDYAGALSTVIPIASAAHISFAQVAGAIATMTQHGTSADEATQELSHTIRNLQSPNGVAVKAMQQLGLSVTDVTKNLGKRGLTGTIDLITNAITHHMGPSGMVAVSAFKQSQAAAADLSVELSKMPKPLADISRQFETGKMSYKDYYKHVKDLGGQAFALGKGFLSTFTQAKGFNDLLKSGSPAARTFAGTLKNVLGTATSMNTALQLGGENAEYFKKTTDDVAKASRKTGGDVLGWAKTSQTLQVKMDKAKASLQVLALEIGNALIPAVTKIVGWIRQAVDWFTHLSGTQKQVLAWSLGILAALGPVLTIGARLGTVAAGIGRFAGGIGTVLGRMTGQTEATQLRMANAMRGISSALAGAAVGYTVAQFTKNASTTTKWMGVLGSTAAGAAIGFSMGGPLGAGIGALAGGISSLAATFLHVGDSANDASKVAQAALDIQNSSAETLLGTLKQVNGAYGEQTRAATADLLGRTPIAGKGSPNVLAAGFSLGINPADMTQAALGNQQILAKVQKQLLDFAGTAKDALSGEVLQALANVTIGAGKSEAQWELYNAALGKAIVGSKGLAKALSTTGGTGLANENKMAGQASASSLRNAAAISEVAKANRDAALASLAHGTSLKKVITNLNGMNGSIKFTTDNLHFNSAAVDELISRYKLTPHQIITTITANTTPGKDRAKQFQTLIDQIRQNKVPGVTADTLQGLTLIDSLQRRIDALRGKTVAVNVINTTTGNLGVKARAGGGWAPEGMFWSGERGPELNFKHGNRTSILSAPKSRAFSAVMGIKVPGFAKGTPDTAKVGSAIGVIGQSYTKPIDLASVGNTRIRAQIANALAVLNDAIRRGLSKASAASFKAEITSLTAEANAQLSTLRLKIRDSDFTAFRVGLMHAVSDTTAALSTLLADVRAAGGSGKVIATVTAEQTKLLALQKQRVAVTDQLTAAQSKWHDAYVSGQSATFSTFDITAAPSQTYNDRAATSTVGGILGSVRTAVANARRFAYILRHLAKKGLNPLLVQQLAAAGPAAMSQAQALMGATPADMASLNSNYSALSSYSKNIGTTSANGLVGGLVGGLESQQSVLNAAVKKLAEGMLAQLRHTLGMHSPSRVMRTLGQNTVEGYRLGLVDRLEDVRAVSKDLGNGAVPNAQGATWKRTAHGGGHTFHIYETHDAGATAMAVIRRERMAGYGSA